ncbi:metallophosphoesterase [Halorubrum ejinorense]|uniref:Metallophosphoesterase n=1 Tax=Halorubrum ejinorense TaxID=425309 RepID=A0AAV3SW16_9EURY
MTGPPHAPDAEFAERAVYLAGPDALVVADLHVGRGEASAVSLPLGERADLTDRLAALLDRFEPATLVVAGDVVHTFDRVSDRAAETLRAVREACSARGAELRLVAGNHDTALAAAWDGPVSDSVVLEAGASRPEGPESDGPSRTTVVCHGHEPPSAPADRYVFGHVHPTIEIEGDRRPCFLSGAGAYRGADVLLVPAFTRLAAGVAVNRLRADGFDSPLVTDAADLAPIVYDGGSEEALLFPPLGEFRELL